MTIPIFKEFRSTRLSTRLQESNPVAALSDMMDMIDASPKTVVAALNGPALGGGCVARRFVLFVFSWKLGDVW